MRMRQMQALALLSLLGGTIRAEDAVVVTPEGNVGIGTPTPGATLDVAGELRIGQFRFLSGYPFESLELLVFNDGGDVAGDDVDGILFGEGSNTFTFGADGVLGESNARIRAGSAAFNGMWLLPNLPAPGRHSVIFNDSGDLWAANVDGIHYNDMENTYYFSADATLGAGNAQVNVGGLRTEGAGLEVHRPSGAEGAGLHFTSADHPEHTYSLESEAGVLTIASPEQAGTIEFRGNETSPGHLDVHCYGRLYAHEIEAAVKNFVIAHPLPEKSGSLVHASIEGPRLDLLYRGQVQLKAGRAEVSIDAAAGMTQGTFAALTRDPAIFVQNQMGWTPVRGYIANGLVSIEAQDLSCEDTVAWMVVAERQDPAARALTSTDADGHLLVETDTQQASSLVGTASMRRSDQSPGRRGRSASRKAKQQSKIVPGELDHYPSITPILTEQEKGRAKGR